MSDRDLVPFSGAEPPAPPPAAPPVGRWVLTGLVMAAVMFGGFGSWAAMAPLSSAALAPGMVKVDGNRKTVQHFEGGIIAEILVRDGDVVEGGQVLLRLDALDAEAEQETIRGQLDGVIAREARLLAQRDGAATITFPTDLLARRDRTVVELAMAGQERIFTDQARAEDAEMALWRQRIEQHRANIASLEAQIAAGEAQIPSLREELSAAEGLFEKGFGLKTRVTALERQIATEEGHVAANQARMRALQEQIAEAMLQIDSIRSERARGVSEELREVQTRMAELEETLRRTDARAYRREVLAPEDGVVMNLRHFTPGGVIAPGGAILDLVPLQDDLVLDVRVQPMDVDVVRPGLAATVRLVAYKQRTTPTLEGRVIRVSPDVVIDERSGASYFTATVEVGADELARVPDVQLYPGMPVDVAIVTGERTLVDYLVQPFTDSFARAFKED